MKEQRLDMYQQYSQLIMNMAGNSSLLSSYICDFIQIINCKTGLPRGKMCCANFKDHIHTLFHILKVKMFTHITSFNIQPKKIFRKEICLMKGIGDLWNLWSQQLTASQISSPLAASYYEHQHNNVIDFRNNIVI